MSYLKKFFVRKDHHVFFAIWALVLLVSWPQVMKGQVCGTHTPAPNSGKCYDTLIGVWSPAGMAPEGNWVTSVQVSNTATSGNIAAQAYIRDTNGNIIGQQMIIQVFGNPQASTNYVGLPTILPGGTDTAHLLGPSTCTAGSHTNCQLAEGLITGSIKMLVIASSGTVLDQQRPGMNTLCYALYPTGLQNSATWQSCLPFIKESDMAARWQGNWIENNSGIPYKGIYTSLAVVNGSTPQTITITVFGQTGIKIGSFTTPVVQPGGVTGKTFGDMFGATLFPSGFVGDYPGTFTVTGDSGGPIALFEPQVNGQYSMVTLTPVKY